MGDARTSLLASDFRTANGYNNRGGRLKEHINEDAVLGYLSRRDDDLSARNGAVGSAVLASGHGVRSVVDDDLLVLGSHGLAVLVCGDVLREEITPVVVRVVVDVAVRVCNNAGRSDGADVVGFSIVVPGNDLQRVSR